MQQSQNRDEAKKQMLQMFQGLVEESDDEFVKNNPSKRHKSRENKEQHSAQASTPPTSAAAAATAAPYPANRRGRSRDSTATTLEQLTYSMARLLIRHEDAIQTIKQNTAFMLYVKTTSTLLPLLYKVSKKWKAERDQVLSLDMPLRSVLLTCLLQDLLRKATRVQQLLRLDLQHADYQKALAEIQQHQSKQILDDKGHFLAKSWDQSKKCLQVRPEERLHADEACILLQRLAAAVTDPQILQRFHSMRPLSTQYAGSVLPFFLEVGWRHASAANVWEDLNVLTRFSVLELVEGQLCRTSLQRSPLAQEIQQQLANLSRR